jgi:hypothetical protein
LPFEYPSFFNLSHIAFCWIVIYGPTFVAAIVVELFGRADPISLSEANAVYKASQDYVI